MQHRLIKSLGPIIISVLSIFVCFLILQPLACFLDPSFSLFANKGIGKIGITLLVLIHIFCLLFTAPKAVWRSFIQTNFSFFLSPSWLKDFFIYFSIFFSVHAVFLSTFFLTGAANLADTSSFSLNNCGLKLLFGFIVTFFLAWTEELIFRGTVFPLLSQNLSPLISAIISSLIFMAAHDLTNPLNLFTVKWKLGLGLFLLGLFLNLIFIQTKKLYAGMGIHAGLVYVKVFLRRIPLIAYGPIATMPWWLDKDLRQAPVFHAAFFVACLALIYVHCKDKIGKK